MSGRRDLVNVTSSVSQYDVVIVGGGPAGVSAGLVLGRCGRRVVVIDAGKPRNYAARAMHNYMSRDGRPPRDVMDVGWSELAKYGVERRAGRVTEADCRKEGFDVRLESGEMLASRKLLLATGVRDELPTVKHFAAFYGLGVHHCPYCDGYEYRGKVIAAYGLGRPGVGLALNLLTWSDKITVCTDGRRLTSKDRRELSHFGIALRDDAIDCLEAERGEPTPGAEEPLRRVVFRSGPPLEVAALFFNTGQTQRSDLPLRLGCAMNRAGGVAHDARQRTSVAGLYLAGDASKDVQFVIVAAAEGAKAGVAINTDLQKEERSAVMGLVRPTPAPAPEQLAGI